MNAAAILKLLEQGEDLINRDERGDALAVLAQAKALATLSDDEDADTETLFPDLIGHGGADTIHNATCMLEHLGELQSEYAGESPPGGDDASNCNYGGWLLNRAVASLLRHGLRQLIQEGPRHE